MANIGDIVCVIYGDDVAGLGNLTAVGEIVEQNKETLKLKSFSGDVTELIPKAIKTFGELEDELRGTVEALVLVLKDRPSLLSSMVAVIQQIGSLKVILNLIEAYREMKGSNINEE